MSILQALTLGLLQGATEFLPVSSSGHLVLVEHFWSLPPEMRVALTAVLHAGTALALVVFFRRRLAEILRGTFARDRAVRTQNLQLIGMLAVATVPAVVFGLVLEDWFRSAFANPRLTALMLLVTGAVLLATRFAARRERILSWGVACVIGFAQALAIVPGISRAGMTVGAAVLLGMKREDAFEFSFILSVPVVVGAAVRELARIDLLAVGVSALGLGVVAALFAGLGALLLLRHLVVRGRLHWFAPYCWAVGLVTLVLLR